MRIILMNKMLLAPWLSGWLVLFLENEQEEKCYNRCIDHYYDSPDEIYWFPNKCSIHIMHSEVLSGIIRQTLFVWEDFYFGCVVHSTT